MRSEDTRVDTAFAATQYIKEKEYWMNQLSGEWTRSSFPFDYYKKPPGKATGDGIQLHQLTFNCPAELFSTLIRASNNSDLRLFMILVTGMVVLLYKYGGNEDIVIGSPIENQEIKGEFINTILALRHRFRGDMTSRELLMQVRQTFLEACENQNYPLETLPYELNLEVGEDKAFPLFNLALLLKNIHDRSYIGHINLDMIFSFSRTDEYIKGEVEYNPLLYEKEAIKRITVHFSHLLGELFHNVDAPILDVEVMTEKEKAHLLVEMNDTGAGYPQYVTIRELFENQVEKTPLNIAAEEAETGRLLSYKELNEKANQLSALLRGKGLNKGNIVAIMGERNLEIVIGILAILKSGGCYLPLDAQNPDERIKFILEDSRACIFLSQEHIICQRQHIFRGFPPGNVIAVNDEDIYRGKVPNTLNKTQSTDLAYVIYTSGTTGKPKGVMIEHRSLVNYIHWAVKNYVKNEPLNFPLYTSIAFDLTVTSIFTPLVTGNTVVLYSGWGKGNLIARIVDDDKVGAVKVTPSHLYLIKDKEIPPGQSRIKRFIVGGEVLETPLAADIHHNFHGNIEIYNEYGPTEATVGCMLYLFNSREDNRFSVPIGIPAANTGIYLLDKNLNPVPTGASGEIYIAGSGLARGYLNRPELTAEKFIKFEVKVKVKVEEGKIQKDTKNLFHQSPLTTHHSPIYRTGDLARWLANGNIEFLGRVDQQIKIRGFRIELGEIERQLLSHAHIKAAVVTLKETTDKFLCAYIVSDKTLTTSHLREYVTGKLPDYMVPAFFVRMAAIPLTPNGKVDRKALPEPEIKGEAQYIPPRNEIEQKLVEIWSIVLGTPKENIGIDANFFEIGGHSLSATVLAANIHKKVNVKLSLVEIFRTPTIRDLSGSLKASWKKETEKDTFVAIEPVEEKDYYPLSSAQKRLYILQQMDIGNIGYNIPVMMEVEGTFSVEKLENTFRELIKRHDNFRTSFQMRGDEPIQRIAKHTAFQIQYHSAVEETKENDAYSQGIVKDFIKAFDLGQAPLLKVGLIKLADKRHVLMIDMHHVISDGISMVIFVKECMALYAGEDLPALRIQYRDYSQWQGLEKVKENMRSQEAYWLKEFESEIPILELPTDYPRPTFQDYAGSKVWSEITGKEYGALRQLALEQETTLYNLLLVSCNILLAKISGQEDIVVGTPIAGRQHADLEHVMGMFVNTLVLRNYPTQEKSAREFLKEVSQKTLNALENSDYPFEVLVDKLSLTRDVSRNPLFDFMFDYDNVQQSIQDIPDVVIPGVTLKPYRYENTLSKFDMSLMIIDREEKLLLFIGYCTLLFKRETIERFVSFLKAIIFSVLNDIDGRLGDIDILSAKEKEWILYDFNNTGKEFPWEKTIHRLFHEQARKTPHHTAVVLENQQITYREFDKKTDILAGILQKKGIGGNCIVGIMMERSLKMIIGLLGILKTGGAYLPIDPQYPSDRKKYILEDSGTRFLLIERTITGNTAGSYLSPGVLIIDPEDVLQERRQGAVHQPDSMEKHPAHLAYIIYTSGSTGKPKGVMIQHRQLVNYICWAARTYIKNEPLKVPLYTSISFDLTVTSLFLPLVTGNAVVVYGMSEGECLLEKIIDDNRVGVIKLTPSHLNLIKDKKVNTHSIAVKRLIVGGEQLKTGLAGKIYENFNGKIEIYNEYGPTETTVGCILHQFNPAKDKGISVPIGHPIDNTEIYILDRSKKPVPPGTQGEIYISGDGLARGYLNRQDLTAERFAPHPFIRRKRIYTSGDLARRFPGGPVEFLGRKDHQVKIRGYRIELREIEHLLLRHPAVKETVVRALEDDSGDKYLCAYFVSHPSLTRTGLQEYLTKFLPEYMIPGYFVQMEQIPLTTNGKVDIRALPKPVIEIGREYDPPRGVIEERIAGIWSEVLGIEKKAIGRDINFFGIGGHSLRAASVITRMREEFNVTVPLLEFFRNPLIKELARYVKLSPPAPYEAIEPTEKKEYYLLSSQQLRLFFHQKTRPGSTLYNITSAVEFEGRLTTNDLEHTLRKLIKRHECLRTSFELMDSSPVQRIPNDVGFKIEHYPIENEAGKSGSGDGKTTAEILTGFVRAFDLTKAPLLRAGLIELGRNRYVFVLDIHHIVTDGSSNLILTRELTALHQGIELPRLKLQYKDYSQWFQRMKKGDLLKKQENYWLKVFEKEVPVLDLPIDFQRPAEQHFEGRMIDFQVAADRTRTLERVAYQEDVTLYMLLLTIYYVLLYKLSHQEDIIVGTPVAGRSRAELHGTVGFLVNTLALRNFPGKDKTVNAFLREVKERTLEAFENQDYQFEDLVNKALKHRDTSRNPLFDTMFVWQNMDRVDVKVEDLLIKPYTTEYYNSMFDLTLFGGQVNGTLHFHFQYNTKLFKEETLKRFIDYFQEIITLILENREVELADIKLSHDLTAVKSRKSNIEFSF